MTRIWHFNLNKEQIYIPDSSTVIPGIKSLKMAHKLMDDSNFNAKDWAFCVKSRTGKPYGFATCDDAVSFAQKRSTKNVAYVVYKNGMSMMAFINKKRLDDWKPVFEWKETEIHTEKHIRTYEIPEETLLTYISIDTVPGKVRVKTRYMKRLFDREVDKIYTRFWNDSIVFHENGTVNACREGKLYLESPYKMSSFIPGYNMGEEGAQALRKALIELKPELEKVLAETKSPYDFPRVFSKPTYRFAIDTYKNTVTKRNQEMLIKYTDFPSGIVDESKLIDVIAKKIKVPVTKSLKKAYSQNLNNMAVVKTLKDYGFTDVNSFQKLISIGELLTMRTDGVFPDSFIKALIRIRGENKAVQMLHDSSFNLIRDITWSYDGIDDGTATVIIKDARNLEEIHDTFNVSRRGGVKINKKIKYSDEEIAKFNLQFGDGFRFELAESSKDLAVVGYKMGICVGGYAPVALMKNCYIVKFMHCDKHIACIEVSPDGTMRQLKAKFNNMLPAEYKSFVDKWLEHSGVCGLLCSDYKRIGEPWHSNCNYAHIRPEEFVEREHDTLRIVRAEHDHIEHPNMWFEENANDLADYRHNAVYGNLSCHAAVEAEELPF